MLKRTAASLATADLWCRRFDQLRSCASELQKSGTRMCCRRTGHGARLVTSIAQVQAGLHVHQTWSARAW